MFGGFVIAIIKELKFKGNIEYPKMQMLQKKFLKI